MMVIKNSKIPIRPLDANHKGINLVQALETFNGKVPDFGYMNDSVEYDTEKSGWKKIADVLRPHTYDNKFWRLVNRL